MRRGGHIPESKWRWEGVISAESSGGHAVGEQPHTPCAAQAQAFRPLSSPDTFLTLHPILPLPLHDRKQASEERQELVPCGP